MKKFEGMLLACDMDGTLLSSDHSISPVNLQALRYFTDEGGLFSLATGRAFAAVTDYLDLLPINAPYSLLNGSLIMNAQHKPLHCAGMPAQSVALIEDVLARFPRVGCEIFLPERIFICRMSPETEHHMRVLHLDYTFAHPSELPDPSDWCQINFTGMSDEIAAVRTFIEPYSATYSAVATIPTFCEVTRSGIGKGTALKQIAADCAIPQTRIFAIGDSDNDLSMLQWAKLSFIPKNAAPQFLHYADILVRDNDHDAVADAIAYLEEYTND